MRGRPGRPAPPADRIDENSGLTRPAASRCGARSAPMTLRGAEPMRDAAGTPALRVAPHTGRRPCLHVTEDHPHGHLQALGQVGGGQLSTGFAGAAGARGADRTPSALALITTTFPAGKSRNTAMGVYAAMGSVGATVGLLLGGTLPDVLDWRWVFFVDIPIGLAVLAGTRTLVEAAGNAAAGGDASGPDAGSPHAPSSSPAISTPTIHGLRMKQLPPRPPKGLPRQAQPGRRGRRTSATAASSLMPGGAGGYGRPVPPRRPPRAGRRAARGSRRGLRRSPSREPGAVRPAGRARRRCPRRAAPPDRR